MLRYANLRFVLEGMIAGRLPQYPQIQYGWRRLRRCMAVLQYGRTYKI
eukprot:SAG11_NODE_478_length_9117_cov_6.916168_10_plen_48_part_00